MYDSPWLQEYFKRHPFVVFVIFEFGIVFVVGNSASRLHTLLNASPPTGASLGVGTIAAATVPLGWAGWYLLRQRSATNFDFSNRALGFAGLLAAFVALPLYGAQHYWAPRGLQLMGDAFWVTLGLLLFGYAVFLKLWQGRGASVMPKPLHSTVPFAPWQRAFRSLWLAIVTLIWLGGVVYVQHHIG